MSDRYFMASKALVYFLDELCNEDERFKFYIEAILLSVSTELNNYKIAKNNTKLINFRVEDLSRKEILRMSKWVLSVLKEKKPELESSINFVLCNIRNKQIQIIIDNEGEMKR